MAKAPVNNWAPNTSLFRLACCGAGSAGCAKGVVAAGCGLVAGGVVSASDRRRLDDDAGKVLVWACTPKASKAKSAAGQTDSDRRRNEGFMG